MDQWSELGRLLFSISCIPDVTAFLENRGTNFAVGGSTSLDLAGQIGAYLGNNGGQANPTDLYVVWIGANDFQAGLQNSGIWRYTIRWA